MKLGSVESDWAAINAGVPQGTLMGPVGFLFLINDFHTACDTVKYVDDSTIWETCPATGEGSTIQAATDEAGAWTERNKMALNCDKTKELRVSFSRTPSVCEDITVNDAAIEQVSSAKLLGVTITNDLKWHEHVDAITSKGAQRLYFLTLLKRAAVDQTSLVRIYVSLVRSVMEYACQVWHTGLTGEQTKQLESIQRRAMDIIFPDLCYMDALKLTRLDTLGSRREELCRSFFEAMKKSGHKLHHLLPPQREARYNLRSTGSLSVPRCRTGRFMNTLIPYGLRHWN